MLPSFISLVFATFWQLPGHMKYFLYKYTSSDSEYMLIYMIYWNMARCVYSFFLYFRCKFSFTSNSFQYIKFLFYSWQIWSLDSKNGRIALWSVHLCVVYFNEMSKYFFSALALSLSLKTLISSLSDNSTIICGAIYVCVCAHDIFRRKASRISTYISDRSQCILFEKKIMFKFRLSTDKQIYLK